MAYGEVLRCCIPSCHCVRVGIVSQEEVEDGRLVNDGEEEGKWLSNSADRCAMRHTVRRTLPLLAAFLRVLACSMIFSHPMNICSSLRVVFMGQIALHSRGSQGYMSQCATDITSLSTLAPRSYLPRRAEKAHPAVLNAPSPKETSFRSPGALISNYIFCEHLIEDLPNLLRVTIVFCRSQAPDCARYAVFIMSWFPLQFRPPQWTPMSCGQDFAGPRGLWSKGMR